jgi:hypothetical protein
VTPAEIAERGTILRVLVGSGVHGTAIEGQDDRDEMGLCVEPPEHVIGLRTFEQYVYRTQPEGVRSGPGDLDLTVYSLRKWTRLAMAGNPTVLLPLFVPDEHVVEIAPLGRALRATPDLVVSRVAAGRFAGYLRNQRSKLLGEHPSGTNRPELIDRYGFDTKFAMHMVRLGLQGVELLESGRISLPVPEPHRTWLRELRVGEHSRDEALAVAGELEARIEALAGTSSLPPEPDAARIDAWLIAVYQQAWATGARAATLDG